MPTVLVPRSKPRRCHCCGQDVLLEKVGVKTLVGDEYEGMGRVLNGQDTHLKFDDVVHYSGGSVGFFPQIQIDEPWHVGEKDNQLTLPI